LKEDRDVRKKKIIVTILLIFFACLVVGLICDIIMVNRHYPLRYVDIANEHVEMFGLEPAFVFAVIHAESNFNSRAVSRVDASGLMQIMVSTAYWIAPRIGLEDFNYEDQTFDPATNIHLGTYYLSMLIETFGDVNVALAAYNAD